MKSGTIVKHGDRIGVVASDIMGCCTDDEEPVVYDGTDSFHGTPTDELEVIGEYDTQVENPEGCGTGGSMDATPAQLWAQAEREHDADPSVVMNRRYQELMREHGFIVDRCIAKRAMRRCELPAAHSGDHQFDVRHDYHGRS